MGTFALAVAAALAASGPAEAEAQTPVDAVDPSDAAETSAEPPARAQPDAEQDPAASGVEGDSDAAAQTPATEGGADEPSPSGPDERAPADGSPTTEPAVPPPAGGARPGDSEGGFFNGETEGDAPSSAPPMPEIEELPSKGAPPPVEEKKRRSLFDLGPKDRPPAGSDGGSFFDPGKLNDTGQSGGVVQIRGFVAANFFVTMRTNTQRREADQTFERLKPLPFFDLRSATLYVGAPIYADVVYARVGFEFISIPTQTNSATASDIIGQSRRFVAFETGALEINPFAWAKKTGRWFREGFKLTAGVFIVPFGLEDEEHAAPVNWFITRAFSMTNGRVYPGTWSDVGATIKWKPTFREVNPIRPVEIDVGVINGDACSQTRFLDELFSPNGLVARCERILREGEVPDASAVLVPDGSTRIDAPGGVLLPDNNGGKSFIARAQFFPLAALNFGGSFIWGTHPEGGMTPEVGMGSADLRQAPTWRAGAHLEVNFEDIFDTKIPLPHLRGEFIYGEDHAVERDQPEQTDRAMLGGYGQIAQQLFRRKKTRLPGLIVQYRFDFADPDTDVPGVINGVPIESNWADNVHLRESALTAHTFGLRFPVLPRFAVKAEYVLAREDGGPANQLYNDIFGLELVADF